MNNDNIKEVTMLHENQDGSITEKTLPKQEAYHALREEWLESSMMKFKEAEIEYKQNTNDPKYKERYESSLKNLASEYAISKRTFEQKHPFEKGGLYENSPEYSDDDRSLEESRFLQIQELAQKSNVLDKCEERYKEYNPNVMTEPDKMIYTMGKLSEGLSKGQKRDLDKHIGEYLRDKAKDRGLEIKENKEIEKPTEKSQEKHKKQKASAADSLKDTLQKETKKPFQAARRASSPDIGRNREKPEKPKFNRSASI